VGRDFQKDLVSVLSSGLYGGSEPDRTEHVVDPVIAVAQLIRASIEIRCGVQLDIGLLGRDSIPEKSSESWAEESEEGTVEGNIGLHDTNLLLLGSKIVGVLLNGFGSSGDNSRCWRGVDGGVDILARRAILLNILERNIHQDHSPLTGNIWTSIQAGPDTSNTGTLKKSQSTGGDGSGDLTNRVTDDGSRLDTTGFEDCGETNVHSKSQCLNLISGLEITSLKCLSWREAQGLLVDGLEGVNDLGEFRLGFEEFDSHGWVLGAVAREDPNDVILSVSRDSASLDDGWVINPLGKFLKASDSALMVLGNDRSTDMVVGATGGKSGCNGG